MLSNADLDAFRFHHAPLKYVWRAGLLLGTARTWGEVAVLLGDAREDAAALLSREHSEGPNDFMIRE